MKAKGNDQSQAFGDIVNGARQKKKKNVNPAGYRTQVTRFVVERASHYSTNASHKGGDQCFRHRGAWGVQYPFEWPKIGNICYFDQEI
jgi:hypothetical protein